MDRMLYIFSALTRAYGPEGWHVCGKSLQEFIKTGDIRSNFDVKVFGNQHAATKLFDSFGFSIKDNTEISVTINRANDTVTITRVNDLDEVCREFLPSFQRASINFPVHLGAELDSIPKWEDTQSSRVTNENTAFFTAERKKEAHEQIATMIQCAEKVGIKDKMFLAFGGSLGYALCNDFLPNDDDIDINFLPVPQEARHEYLMECKKAGLCESRLHGPVSTNSEYVWFSIGRKSPYCGGVKACIWFWFEHGGYWWHSKGGNWSSRKELYPGYPTSKGIPNSIFTGELREVVFGGNKINIPVNLGKCLDWWYPKWIYREQKSSAPVAILVHKNEADKNTWFIERR